MPTCVGKACSWGRSRSGGPLGCQSGTGDCAAALMVEAEASEFHDQKLIEATRAIKLILEGFPATDPQGRKLSFVHTNMGTLLAWVDHDAALAEDAVTAADDDATVASMLGLKGYTAAAASQA